jgi:hypothetical protein
MTRHINLTSNLWLITAALPLAIAAYGDRPRRYPSLTSCSSVQFALSAATMFELSSTRMTHE